MMLALYPPIFAHALLFLHQAVLGILDKASNSDVGLMTVLFKKLPLLHLGQFDGSSGSKSLERQIIDDCI